MRNAKPMLSRLGTFWGHTFTSSALVAPEEDPYLLRSDRSPGGRSLKRHEQEREAAEDRRLFYVTLTRAKDYLVLTTAEIPGEDVNCACNLLDHAFIPVSEARLKEAVRALR